MKYHTSLVAQQTRLSEWADQIRDCQNRPQGMKIDEWCQLHNITKASYYWRLRKVREAYQETAEQTQTFVEVFICKLPISQGFKGFRTIKNR